MTVSKHFKKEIFSKSETEILVFWRRQSRSMLSFCSLKGGYAKGKIDKVLQDEM